MAVTLERRHIRGVSKNVDERGRTTIEVDLTSESGELHPGLMQIRGKGLANKAAQIGHSSLLAIRDSTGRSEDMKEVRGALERAAAALKRGDRDLMKQVAQSTGELRFTCEGRPLENGAQAPAEQEIRLTPTPMRVVPLEQQGRDSPVLGNHIPGQITSLENMKLADVVPEHVRNNMRFRECFDCDKTLGQIIEDARVEGRRIWDRADSLGLKEPGEGLAQPELIQAAGKAALKAGHSTRSTAMGKQQFYNNNLLPVLANLGEVAEGRMTLQKFVDNPLDKESTIIRHE
ncbi:MAG: hypothetical protein GF416_01275 [Candidatus Altiarchaeales archaeon]|nr:hypothetical protein [Candidatus Altiarchaeales archaeon]MBD3415747.1 hypothetical protein [Candidatus Altiarchaeales archaeon]